MKFISSTLVTLFLIMTFLSGRSEAYRANLIEKFTGAHKVTLDGKPNGYLVVRDLDSTFTINIKIGSKARKLEAHIDSTGNLSFYEGSATESVSEVPLMPQTCDSSIYARDSSYKEVIDIHLESTSSNDGNNCTVKQTVRFIDHVETTLYLFDTEGFLNAYWF